MSQTPPGLDLQELGVGEVLDSLADGAYATDRKRNIIFWNRAAERITGWSREEVVGRSCRDNILVHVDKDGHALCGKEYCPLHRAIVTGEPSTSPLLLFAKSRHGHRIPVEVSVAPLRNSQHAVVGGIEVFRDLASTMDELERARTIQRHAVQCSPLEDERLRFSWLYSPHGVVGGDIYRVERLDEERYAVFLADVMGHGVAAALYTMQIRSLWEDLRPELFHPARFIGELNRRLGVLTRLDSYFATAVYLVVHADTGEVVYVNAGHSAPFLFHSDGSMGEFLVRGLALGLVATEEYAEGRTTLRSGGTLLAYTDGAAEIRDKNGEELGEEGLQRVLIEAEFHLGRVTLEEIGERLLAHGTGIRLEDDLTLVRVFRPAERCSPR